MQTTISILSYNIWFDKRHGEVRYQGIFDLIGQLHPTIIALQEVTPDVFANLYDMMSKRGYFCNYQHVNDFQPSNGYGVCIFSAIPIESAEIIPFEVTRMGRYFVRVLLSNGLYVVTTHLESMSAQAETRQKQIKQLTAHCSTPNSPHILAMDSNLTDVGLDCFPEHTHWVDFYDVVGRPANSTFTYDALHNANILDSYRTRFDRILYKGCKCKCVGFRLEGTKILKNTNLPPSDHFGVFVVIAV